MEKKEYNFKRGSRNKENNIRSDWEKAVGLRHFWRQRKERLNSLEIRVKRRMKSGRLKIK